MTGSKHMSGRGRCVRRWKRPEFVYRLMADQGERLIKGVGKRGDNQRAMFMSMCEGMGSGM